MRLTSVICRHLPVEINSLFGFIGLPKCVSVKYLEALVTVTVSYK